jgi:mono/diheme cytochrome c family protein
VGLVLNTALAVLLVATAVRADANPSAAQAAQKTTRDKVYSKEQAARGEAQFGKMCASCHDPVKVPAGNKPAPQLIGEKFLDKWDGKTLDELITGIAANMPNDGSAVVTEDEAADLVAYLLKANNFPDGAAPLKPGATSKEIVIVK